MIPFQVFIMIWNLPQKLIKFLFIITSNMICENLCRWIINYYIVKRVEHGITFRRNWQKKLCQQLFWIIWSNYFSYHHIDFFSVKVFSGDIYCLCPQREQIIVFSKVKLLHLVRNHEQKRVLKWISVNRS